MKSPVVKRSIVIAGHKTSVSLEEAFWKCLKEIATSRDLTLSAQNGGQATNDGNLSSAIRLFVLDHFRAQNADPRPQSASRASGARATASAFQAD